MKIALFQPVVPVYRVPVYDLLGSQPGIELKVFSGGQAAGSLTEAVPTESFEIEYARMHPLRLPACKGLSWQSRRAEAMDPQRFDLCILPWDSRNILLPYHAALARLRGMPLVLWGHGYSKQPRKLTEAWRRLLGRIPDGLLLYTRTVANALTQRYHFLPSRVFVAQNAIDQRPIQSAAEFWRNRPERLKQFADGHGLSANRTVIFISRLEPDNQIDMMIDATAELHRWDNRCRLVLVGTGSQREVLESRAKAKGIAAAVRFVGACYQEMELAPWALNSTVMAYPTNIGLSLLHAFGYGLPVITGDNLTSQNPEIEALRDGWNGLLFREGSVMDLARKCRRVMEESELRGYLGANALETVLTRYTIANMVQGFLDATQLVDGKIRTVITATRAADAP